MRCVSTTAQMAEQSRDECTSRGKRILEMCYLRKSWLSVRDDFRPGFSVGDARFNAVRRGVPSRKWFTVDAMLGQRGPGISDGGESQQDRADANRVAVDESGRRIESTIRDERAVLAFKILDRRFVGADYDPRMAAGDISRIEEQLQIGVAAEHVFTVGEPNATAGPYQTEARLLAATLPPFGGRLRGHVSERIAKSVDGTDELRMRRVVAEGRTDLRDEIDEILFDNEGLGPELLLKN